MAEICVDCHTKILSTCFVDDNDPLHQGCYLNRMERRVKKYRIEKIYSSLPSDWVVEERKK